jgi:hypothetical protein
VHLRPKHQCIAIIIIIIAIITTTTCVLVCNILNMKDDLVDAISCQYVSDKILKL